MGGHDVEAAETNETPVQTEQNVMIKKVTVTDTLGVDVELELKDENGVSSTTVLSGNPSALSIQDKEKLEKDGFDLD